jgi:hypothetical protein
MGGRKCFSSLSFLTHEEVDDANCWIFRNVTHYSYFGAFRSSVSNVGPNAAMLDPAGKLTDIGSWYMGGVATHNAPKESGATRNMLNILGTSKATVQPYAWTAAILVVATWGHLV